MLASTAAEDANGASVWFRVVLRNIEEVFGDLELAFNGLSAGRSSVCRIVVGRRTRYHVRFLAHDLCGSDLHLSRYVQHAGCSTRMRRDGQAGGGVWWRSGLGASNAARPRPSRRLHADINIGLDLIGGDTNLDKPQSLDFADFTEALS